MKNFIREQEIVEECGVIGIYNVHNAANLAYYGLHALQHRGQEGCGIVSVYDKALKTVKGEGLVTEVFNNTNLENLKGEMCIGHVRYANKSGQGLENVQPLTFHHHTGDFALAHNGSIINSRELKRYLEDKGSIFQTNSDSEILAHLIKKSSNEKHRITAIIDALNMLEGAFSFVIMSNKKLYACRDKYGIRPLSIGKLNGGYVVSSETCAFEILGVEFIRDVLPGEVVVFDETGLVSHDYSKFKHHKMCVMEYIYFARPDSNIEGCNVHTFRKESGKILSEEYPVEADIVIGAPDSATSSAIGYSEASKIPYEMGLIKNRYVGRTFIQPSQDLREKGVRMKLSAVSSIVGGKRVVLVDDSMVRGTTSKRIVTLLKEAGAKEVHVRISSPQFKYPCFYGVDTSTYEELICSRHTKEEVREIIGADSLEFLSEEGVYKAAKRNELCIACFNGKYPTALYQAVEQANKDGKF